LSASGLFLTLAIFALLFRQSRGFMTPEKRKRNAIYLGCAIVIVLCIATIGVFSDSLKTSLWLGIPAFYALETLALWAFGISWFIKGETLFKDKTPAYPGAFAFALANANSREYVANRATMFAS
jgi:hypothetical protein